MADFLLRKNAQQLIRISRGPFEGHDITRLQIWYKDRDSGDYKPGRVVAFNSEMIPGIVEGLRAMADQKPRVEIANQLSSPALRDALLRILKVNRIPMHWEVIAEIVGKEAPELAASKWAVYNCLLSNGDHFTAIEEDVFEAAKTKEQA